MMLRNVQILLMLVTLDFLFSISNVYALKILTKCPSDNTYIYEDTILPSGICNIEDKRVRNPGEEGAIIIKADNIVLDCNNTIINGTGQNASHYPNYAFGIFNYGYHNITVKNCIVQNYDDGILFVRANNSKIYNNTLISNNNGIVFDGAIPNYQEQWERTYLHKSTATYVEIFNNILKSNGGGINLLFSNNNFIYNNTFISQERDGIELETSSYNHITDNSFTKNKVAVLLQEFSNYNNISNNIFRENIEAEKIINSSFNPKKVKVFFELNPKEQEVLITRGNLVYVFQSQIKDGYDIELEEGEYSFNFTYDGLKPLLLSMNVSEKNNRITSFLTAKNYTDIIFLCLLIFLFIVFLILYYEKI